MRNSRERNIFFNLLGETTLLPVSLEEQRMRLQVVDSIPVAAHPEGSQSENLMFDTALQENLRSTSQHIIGEVKQKNLFWMDKLFPHAQLELMLMEGSGEIIPSLYQLNHKTIKFVFSEIERFALYSRTQGLRPSVSWSFDPDTHVNDRESGQGVKRWHAHFIARDPVLMQRLIEDRSVFLSDERVERRRRLVDESSIALSYLLAELITKKINLPDGIIIQPPFSQGNLPVFSLNLGKNGWSFLNSGDVQDFLQSIHLLIIDYYIQIHALISDGYQNQNLSKTRRFVRPKYNFDDTSIKKLNEFLLEEGVSLDTTNLLVLMLQSCNPNIILKLYTDIMNGKIVSRDLLTFLYPLAGPAYSTAILEKEPKGDVVVVIRPYLFSDLGGAGLTYVFDKEKKCWLTVKLKKSQGTLSPKEYAERKKFQMEFLKKY